MTATEKVLRNKNDDVLSMDEDSNDYGETIYFLSHGEAISSNPPIISDYRIVTLEIPEVRIKKIMNENEYLFEKGGEFEKAEAKDVGSCLALIDLFEKFSCRKGISFHSSIKRSEEFNKLCSKISELLGYGEIGHYTVSSKLPPGKRTSVIDDFDQSKKALITNARCLNEGVDLPAVDCVIFADPKNSLVDIVQASGRALRLHEDKEFGFILIPLIVPENLDFEEFAQESNFRHIARTITSLSIYDNRIVEQFRLIDKGIPGGGRGPVIIEEFKQTGININQFKQSLFAKIWSNVGRSNWMPFEEAREFVQSLGIASQLDWIEYAKTNDKPADIPAAPHTVYNNKGWESWIDWLGKDWRPYTEAREFVRSLKLKSVQEWKAFTKTKNLPYDIPKNPRVTYKNRGWEDMGDFLGTEIIALYNKKFRPFKKARAFVRSLNIKKESEWRAYCKNKEFPKDIPKNPRLIYKNHGWVSSGDWFGTGSVSKHSAKFRTFKEARKFARSSGIKSYSEWNEYSKSGNMPKDLPSNPHRQYRNQGWISMEDFLGKKSKHTPKNLNRPIKKFRSFTDARAFARSLKLQSFLDWQNFSKSGEKPEDIPSSPNHAYKNQGWNGIEDFLGYSKKFRPFEDARVFARGLGLNSIEEWLAYSKSGKRPKDIPSHPDLAYKNQGWKSMSDWLDISPRSKKQKSGKEKRIK